MNQPNQPQYQPLPPQPPKPPKKRRTIPLWVFILALVGVMFASCTAGVGMGASDTSQPVAASDTAGTEQREKALDERENDLDALQSEIVDRDKALDDRESALDKREGKLDKKEEKKAEQEAANSFPGDGVFMVGEDVKPGTYRTKGSAGFGCYWARLKDTSGDFGAIITNGNAEGPTTVTIAGSDGAFETSGCHDWKRR